MSHRNVIRVLGIFVLLAGCDDLREFKTGPDQVFRGEVIGSDAEQLTESFIRKGFESHTLLELRFNPGASGLPVMNDGGSADGARSVPGTLHTYTCSDGRNSCSAEEGKVGPFDHAPLLTIEALAHDTLSQYTFPGGGRLQNYIFGARYSTQLERGAVVRDARRLRYAHFCRLKCRVSHVNLHAWNSMN